MSLKFIKLTRPQQRKLTAGQYIEEHGIRFERLANSDGRYTVNIMVDGQRIHRVIGKESDGTTRMQAEDFITQIKQDAKTGRLNLPKGRKIAMSFSEAAQLYLEKLTKEDGKDLVMKNRRLQLHLKPFFKDIPLSKISNFDVERYKKYRKDEKAALATINRELAVLSHLWSKAIEWKWIDKKPAKINRYKEEINRIVYLTIEQIARVLEAAKEDQNAQVYLFILIGLETSLRRMEILSIRLENIDLNRHVIYIPHAKGGSKEQPITKNISDFLQDYIKKLPADQTWLFPSELSKTGHTMNIEKPFRRVIQRAGFDPKQVVRHTLRHTAITHLVQAGVDLPTVKRISGHKTLQMVERYSHQNGQHIQAAMDKLEQRYRTV